MDAATSNAAGAGYGRAGTDQAASGYAWAQAEADQQAAGYQQAGYDDGAGDPGWSDEADQGAGYSWAGDDRIGASDAWSSAGLSGRMSATQAVASNAVRGFPPEPGEPLPVYPPGPFAAWNRSSADRASAERGGLERGARPADHRDSSRQLAAATITPDEFDTDYSLPAIKDPAPGKAGKPGSTAASGRDRRPPADVSQGRKPAPRGGARPTGKGRSGRRSGKRRQSVWLAIGAATTIIAAVAVILVLTSPGSSPAGGPKANGTPNPVQSSPAPPAGRWEYIGSRTTDSVPLTTAELYPASFTSAGTVYTKVKEAKSTNCRPSLIGGALQAAVRKAGCTQALRATYVSRTAKVMATIGVFNLKSSAAAEAAALKAGHSEFVAQLQSKAGPARKIGQGTGIEEALVKGHYLVLVWAESTDLGAPKIQADRVRLESFMNTVIQQTANVSLSYRMVDGKPVTPG